ncbi:MAG: TonB system transport protein ExbD [Microvirga sp.]|nr:TonB system transport protein ExbD [Microvirga sp.]
MAGRFSTGGDGEEHALAHEINVTPFIDVILVLLIIFMVAAPLATVDMRVDLPAASGAPAPAPPDPLVISLDASGALFVGEASVARDGLAAALDAASDGHREERVFLRADEALPYREVMAVMSDLRAAGYLKVALVGLDAASAGGAPSP